MRADDSLLTDETGHQRSVLFSVLLSGEFKYVMRPLKEVDEEVHRVQFGVPAGAPLHYNRWRYPD